MTHQDMHNHRIDNGLTDIIARDEARPSITRQIFNGVSGTLVLLLTGIIILVMVLWKAR